MTIRILPPLFVVVVPAAVVDPYPEVRVVEFNAPVDKDRCRG